MKLERQQKLNLQNSGILSKAEVRAWYTGESVESAQLEIDKIQEQSQTNLMNDIFNTIPETTLESNNDLNTTGE